LQINGDSKERAKIESGRLSSHGQGHTSQQSSRSNSTAEKLREDGGTPLTAEVESPTQIRVSRPPSVKGSHVRKDEPLSSVPRQEDGKSETPPKITGPSAPGVSTLIIPEAHQDSEDDDDAQFVIEETVFAGSALRPKLGDGDVDEKQQDHGGLVKKMLQSKKDFEAGNILSQSKVDPQGYMNGHIDEATRQRERAQMGKDIDRLCQSLQSLSRSALPLGKLMDFVQEDLESMQQEFERWTAENRTLKARLREEENLTQSSIQPLRAQLAELQNYAAEQRKAIATFKAKILTNDERIHDMLSRSIEKTC
ncbi:TRAF3-interacting protein 1, partial [Clonorchis sinensis]